MAPATATAPGGATSAPAAGAGRRLVAVTACPTGIAHTYMAAEALEAAAGRAGVEIAVETQGSAGSKPLAASVIAAADAVIFAVDVGVRDRARFAGKPLVSSGVKRPIDEGDQMIAEALHVADDPQAARVEGAAGGGGEDRGGAGESFGATVRRVLMTGVSYMIPFVAAGGLLIALGFLLGGYEIVFTATKDGAVVPIASDVALNSTLFNLPDPAAYTELPNGAELQNGALLTYLASLLIVLGQAAFGFLVPALAGYIAYAIADRPGIAPGFVMGAIAGVDQLRLHRRHHRRRPRRRHRQVDRGLVDPDLGARPDAGAGDPAADRAAGRLRDGRGPRPPAGRPDDRAQRRADLHG